MKIPNLDNVHVIFHHQLPYFDFEIPEKDDFKRGYTICKIYKEEELIGEGRADCSLNDQFNRVIGRRLSLDRAFENSQNLSETEGGYILKHISNLPSAIRYRQKQEKLWNN